MSIQASKSSSSQTTFSLSERPISKCDSSSVTTLTEWSRENIKSIFEASTHEAAMKAVENTFASTVYDSIHGIQRTIAEIKMSVTAVRNQASTRLQVEWMNSVEAPEDSSNKNGAFGGFYIIRGLRKVSTDEDDVKEYVRHKAVTVREDGSDEHGKRHELKGAHRHCSRIESQPHLGNERDLDDTRRIVMLGLVAADRPIA